MGIDMRKSILLTAACGVALSGVALAQTTLNRSQEREAVEVITGVGGTCERVTRTQTIGRVDDATTLMAVACSGGEQERYVIQLDNRGNMSFYSTCENLAVATNNQIRCFA